MFDCVVVGAGLCGLTASQELVRRGKSVVILEARDRIGGRVESIHIDGQVIETGGQWVSPGHEAMHELIAEAGLGLVKPTDGDLMVLTQGRTMRSPAVAGSDQPLTPFEIADLGQGVLRLRRLAARSAVDTAWARSNATWLTQPISRWINANLRLPAAKHHLTEMVTSGQTASADELTLNDALQASVRGMDLESLFTATGGLKQRRVTGGLHTLIDTMAEPLADRIRLSSPVVAIAQDDEGVSVTLADSSTVRASRVLLTLPPWLVTELTVTPDLPSWRAEVTGRTSPGNIIKAFVIYDEPWWRAEGLSGQSSADDGAVRVTFDCSDGGPGILMGFFEGSEASTVADQTPAEREEAFVASLSRIFGPKAKLPHRYIDRNWAAEEYSRGSHGAHFSPGIWTANGHLLAEPVGRIYFAGAEYAAKFNGYLEGAVRSGREAARAIAHGLR